MAGLVGVAAGAVAFVGTHFLLSHPLRAPLVSRLGERGFLGVYSLVAFATMAWLAQAYRTSPVTPPLWDVGNGLWIIVTVIMWLASVLLIGSVIRNPALPDPKITAAPPPKPVGVFAITRHPMMWGIALWGIAHAVVHPIAANIVLTGAIVILALVGAAMQDRKKAQWLPGFWPEWQRRTSWWPFAAIAAGRIAARAAWPGVGVLIGGTVLWLIASWAHWPIAGVAAGLWRWVV